MKALYFPYTSPRSRDTILRGLLLYKQIGAICPRDFFLVEDVHHAVISTELERISAECEMYGNRNIVFTLDPVDLLKDDETSFTESVLADMRNPVFWANAPHGKMILYGSKMTREIFETFRDKIEPAYKGGPVKWAYKEGPFRGTAHFVWEVDEPLAHSILLNLALLGINQTRSVPMTDSIESHRAFLFKTCGVDRIYDAHIAAHRLLQIVLPATQSLDIRKILDFRDGHRKEMSAFWRALAEEQKKLARQFDQGAEQLCVHARIEFENLNNAIESAQDVLKWQLGGSIIQLALGLAGKNPLLLASVGATTALFGTRYIRALHKKNISGLAYLLQIGGALG